jgi:hypothetical protein
LVFLIKPNNPFQESATNFNYERDIFVFGLCHGRHGESPWREGHLTIAQQFHCWESEAETNPIESRRDDRSAQPGQDGRAMFPAEFFLALGSRVGLADRHFVFSRAKRDFIPKIGPFGGAWCVVEAGKQGISDFWGCDGGRIVSNCIDRFAI